MSSVLDQRRRAVIMLLLANACWGLSFPLMKALGMLQVQVAPGANGWFTTAMILAPRFLLAALVLAWVLRRQLREIRASEWRQGVGLGGFASLGMLFQADGIQYTDASTSAFLTQFYAILIPIYVAWRARRNPGLRVWGCALLVLAGTAILGRFDWRHLSLGRGEIETLICSVFFMGQILLLEHPKYAGNRVLPITAVMFSVEAVVFLGLMAVTAPGWMAVVAPLQSASWWGMTLVLTLFCTLGAYLLMNRWQPKISATEAGLIYCIEPVFGSVFALFLPGLLSILAAIAYPNETITGALLVGGGLITAANIILQWRPRRDPTRAESIATPITNVARADQKAA
jgi:drug/metabolite transporter (DMT)-like permease